MEVLKSINIKTPIVTLKALWNGKLAVVDSHSALRIINVKNYSTVGGFKSNIVHEYFSPFSADVSMDGKYTLSNVPGTKMAAFFDVDEKKLLYKVGRQGTEIESVALDPLNRYCVTGGQDGKISFWVLKTARLALALPAHTDYVTALAFSDTGHWFASGSYDRSVMVLNMSVMRQPLLLKGGHNSVVVHMAFLSNLYLLTFDRDGNGVIWNLQSGKVHKRLPKMHDEVSAMTLSSDKRFAFVGTKLGYVGLYDLETMQLIQNRYLKEKESITSLAFIHEGFKLAVGGNEGNINIYPLFGDESHYNQLILKRQFKPFYDAAALNPMICFSKSYEEAEKIWKEALVDAKSHLQKKEREKAKQLLSVFSGIPAKNTIITQLLHEYEKFLQFQTNVQEGKYSLAYSMAKQYPSFMESDLYMQMEQKWRKLFTKAQEVIQKPGGEEEARMLLAPFRGISEKTVLIQQMFAEKRVYDFFKKTVVQRDFVKVFELIKNNPFLKEFPEYTALIEYADKLYIQSQIAFMHQEWGNAKKGSEILVYFPDYASEAHELLQTIKIRESFSDATTSGNLSKAFAYMNTYPMLYETPDGMRLENQWNFIAEEGQRLALKGEILPLKRLLEPYHCVQAKYVSMAMIYAQAYQVQIEKRLFDENTKNDVERGIRKYLQLFGVDDTIKNIVDSYNQHYHGSLDWELLQYGSVESWNPSMIVTDICKEEKP